MRAYVEEGGVGRVLGFAFRVRAVRVWLVGTVHGVHLEVVHLCTDIVKGERRHLYQLRLCEDHRMQGIGGWGRKYEAEEGLAGAVSIEVILEPLHDLLVHAHEHLQVGEQRSQFLQ